MYKQNLYLQKEIVISTKRVNQALFLPNKSDQQPRFFQLLSFSGRSEKCSLNKAYFTAKVIQDNYKRIDPVV
jgi:hypothetical protein